MANTGNTQQIIDYGTTANDGTGDPLRTAFIKTDENFNNIWLAGPVGSNITISNNTIQNDSTNGNIIIKPNGTGVIQANAAIVPSAANVRDLGTANVPFRAGYFGVGGVSINGNITSEYVTANQDLTVGGNLTVDGDIVQIGNIITDAKTIQLANTAATDAAANGSGITVGSNDDIATLLYNSDNNEWRTNISANVAGNVTANYFIGNGSQLTGVISSYGNANVAAYLPTYFGNLSANNVNAGNVFTARDVFATTGSFSGDAEGRNSIYAGFSAFTVLGSDVVSQFAGNINQYTQFNFQNANAGNTASGDYVITADNGTDTTHFLNIGLTGSGWDGTQDNSLGNLLAPNDGYFYVQDGNLVIGTQENGNTHIHTWKWDTTGNVTATGNLIPSANLTYSLGNSTNWWSNIWVASNTIYIGGVALGVTGNTLTVAGEPVLSNDSQSNIATTGTITASNIVTNGISSDDSTFVTINDGLTVDGEIESTGNIISNGTVQGNVVTADSAINTAGTIGATGNVTGGNIISDGAIISDGRAYVQYVDIRGGNPSGTIGSIGYGGNIVELQGTAGVNIVTTGDEGGPTWQFGTDGTLAAPGNITATNFIGNVAAANVTGLANVATTGSYDDLSDQPTIPTLGNFTLTDNTIQTGNGVGGITLSIFGPDQGVPDPAFISRDWTFANTGSFTSPGNVSAPNFLGNIAAANVVGTVSAATTAGTVTTAAQANITSVGTLTSLSVSGNIVGGNIDTDGQITVDALSITNSSIAAVTQFTISTSNIATGNSSSILLDRNGVGVVVQLQDTGGGPYSWGLYQDNILFPDGSRQYSAYGNANVVANLAALGSNPISTTGNVTAGNINANVAGYSIGYREIPQVTLSANANVALTDSGKHFYSTTAGNLSLLIPTNANVAFPTGTAFTIVVQAAGNVLVNADSGVNLYLAGNSTAGNRVVSTYGMATVMKVATDTWFINGTGVA